MITKDFLKKKFSKEWQKYYKLAFLINKGFQRKTCKKCGKGFWTLDSEREICPDQPCSPYQFIGNPPTKKKFSYVEAWKAIEKFFVENGHKSIARYPVVARWYPPLYFTSASIVDFYRVENGNVIFEFPANPLIVPQTCLRFNDVANVGLTGKHYTGFVMVGQHSLYDGKEGYWKEKCIELDYKLLTQVFGIKPEEIVFVEDLWLGTGAFGYSLEYFVRGLELGNAVFTEFLITPSGSKPMPYKVIDMGAGLERFPWISSGSPTSYDVVFEPVLSKLKKVIGVSVDNNLLLSYWKLAGVLNLDEVKDVGKAKLVIAKKLGVSINELNENLEPLQALYAVADHTRALTFAITDGMIPSNVGGGYNLRVILRRALSLIKRFKWDFELIDVCELHAKQLKPLFPELEEHLDEINEILNIETQRFKSMMERAKETLSKLEESEIGEKKLIQLYESHGITPDLIKEHFPNIKIPEDFYFKITRKKPVEKEESRISLPVEGLPETKKLFYEEPYSYKFKAEVLKIIRSFAVLNQTLFYPTSGGQLHDTGFINGCRVLDVEKIGEIILHKLDEISFREGETVTGNIDKERREALRKHHTATHIVNAAARKVLGSWVFQHSAFKDVDHAKLDITHYKSLSEDEVEAIENEANRIVELNLPVKIKWMPRMKAEETYGFRIYQGGAVPQSTLRIVEIPGIDVEACGGTHCKTTGEVGVIMILRTKRIQDGVVRLEFCAGEAALKKLREREEMLGELASLLKVSEENVPEAVKNVFQEWKSLRKKARKLRKNFLRKRCLKNVKQRRVVETKQEK